MVDNDEAQVLATLRKMVELQARVCYMNADRTLATWTRTALTLIVFGLVVDRFGLLMARNAPAHIGTPFAANPVSSFGGIILVALGIFVVVTAAIRHQAYKATWNRTYRGAGFAGPWLAFTFAVMVAIVGAAIMAALLIFVT